MRPIFYNHVAAAQITDDICNLVMDLNLFQFFLCDFYRFIQVRIKIPHNRLPVDISLCHLIQQRFHIGRELLIHNRRKCFFHNSVDYLAKFRHVQVSIFLCQISSGKQRRNRRRIGAGTSDAEFFQRFYQGSLCEMRRRLSKMLFLIHLFHFQLCVCIN